ncbi:hypothetical protein AA313_de0208851 [Arthrobotrys entomopaga]|nr:hypothetical protein AA313_de0208851 [Arthrobotrys entomopaga]
MITISFQPDIIMIYQHVDVEIGMYCLRALRTRIRTRNPFKTQMKGCISAFSFPADVRCCRTAIEILIRQTAIPRSTRSPGEDPSRGDSTLRSCDAGAKLDRDAATATGEHPC